MDIAHYILLKDAKGHRLDAGVKATLKRWAVGDAYSPIRLLRGELVKEVKEGEYNCQLYRDPNVFLKCHDEDVAPLRTFWEVLLMEGIPKPADRFDVFRRGDLQFGLELKAGSQVSITMHRPNLAVPISARAVVQFKGRVGDLPGTIFGVEFLERDRLGTTDGTFQDKRYFRCDDGCGLFVPLNRLAKYQPSSYNKQWSEAAVSAQPTYAGAVASPTGVGPAEDTRSKSTHAESSVDDTLSAYSSAFQIGERVCFHNKKGEQLEGTVGWTGKSSGTRKFDFLVVGIQTDNPLFKTDVEHSLPGMDYRLPSVPKHHALFIPESLVEKIPSNSGKNHQNKLVESTREPTSQSKLEGPSLTSALAKEMQMAKENLMEEQRQILKIADDKEKEEAAMKALAGRDANQLDQQRKEYEKLQAHAAARRNDGTKSPSRQSVEVSTGVRSTCNLNVGSLIQIPSLDSVRPFMYGTIKWIGLLPKVSERLAGIELDEYLEGCSDGSWTQPDTGRVYQFFSCAKGKGLYYPLNRVQPDARHAPEKELKDWKLDRSEVRRIPKKQIGSGAWGIVFSGHFRGEPVAFKIVHREVFLQIKGTVDMIKREISIMARIQHPNLVRFIGAVLDEHVDNMTDTPIILLELLDMNLRDAYATRPLERVTMVSIFCDVAYALRYLHEQSEAIIHRDVSAPNVLLKKLSNDSYRAKVSDFGSANLLKQSKTAAAGAILYTAPEMFPQDVSSPPPPHTTKIDVFSYGILLLEVISRDLPTMEKRYLMLETLRIEWNSMHELVMHCTKRSPSDRPTMRQILNELHSQFEH